MRLKRLVLGVLAMSAGLTATAGAQTYSVLYNFVGGSGDGRYPAGSLIQSGSLLYGVTTNGGPADDGAIFSYNLASGAENMLHAFAGGTNDGDLPVGPLLQSGASLFGVTTLGGSASNGTPHSGDGTLFSYSLSTGQETVLHSFTGSSIIGNLIDGSTPFGSLAQVGGTVYGTTLKGGTNNDGTIFSFSSSLFSGVNVVHSFSGTVTDGVGMPVGNLVGLGPTLYGLSQLGGGAGDVFSFNTATSATEGAGFLNGANGGGAVALTQSTQSGSIFYGVANGGGADDRGSLFEFNAGTDAITLLHSFTGSDGMLSSPDGAAPSGPVVQSDTTLYGLTQGGGTLGGGTFYSFNISTGVFTDLYNLDDGPTGGLLMDGSTFYGAMQAGGTNNDGVLFSITVPEPGTFALLTAASVGLLRRRRIV